MKKHLLLALSIFFLSCNNEVLDAYNTPTCITQIGESYLKNHPTTHEIMLNIYLYQQQQVYVFLDNDLPVSPAYNSDCQVVCDFSNTCLDFSSTAILQGSSVFVNAL